MFARRSAGLLFAALGVLGACSDARPAGSHAGGAGAGGVGAGGGSPGIVRLRIFHTSDEHGWIVADEESEPGIVHGGAAAVLGHMRGEDAYDPSRDLLVSSGDNWTGPAVSTWFEGRPVVEVLNAMGYRATAVGNHELDFGTDVLATRAGEASYPHLAGNLRSTETGSPPAFLSSQSVVHVDGVDVAFIGMAGAHTPASASALALEGLVVEPPNESLELQAAAARSAGAEVIVVLFHDCQPQSLLGGVTERIDLVLGGHCHVVRRREVAGVAFVESGAQLRGYTRVDLDYDLGDGTLAIVAIEYRQVAHPSGAEPDHPPDAAVEALVASWTAAAELELAEPVGFTVAGIPDGSWALANWVTDSWLAVHPESELAILNFGSIRQSIAPGDVTVGDVVGVLPFENRIVELDVNGTALVAHLEAWLGACGPADACYPAVAGMRYVHGSSPLVVEVAGQPIAPAASYRLLTTDYLYFGGVQPLEVLDPSPLVTGEHYRDPVLAWTAALSTSPSDPIEAHIDATPRDE